MAGFARSTAIRDQIEELAQDDFRVRQERLAEEYAQRKRLALHHAEATGNCGAYEPILTTLNAEKVKDTILAYADAYVGAFDAFGVAADEQAENSLELTRTQSTGGAIAGVQDELTLLAKRLRITISGGAPNQHISAIANSAVREGKLRLNRQRIKAEIDREAVVGDSGIATALKQVGGEICEPSLANVSDCSLTEKASDEYEELLWFFVERYCADRESAVRAFGNIGGAHLIAMSNLQGQRCSSLEEIRDGIEGLILAEFEAVATEFLKEVRSPEDALHYRAILQDWRDVGLRALERLYRMEADDLGLEPNEAPQPPIGTVDPRKLSAREGNYLGRALQQAVEYCDTPAAPDLGRNGKPKSERAREATAFLTRVTQGDEVTFTESDIWRVAGYKNDRPYQDWKNGKSRSGRAADRKIRAVFAMESNKFMSEASALAPSLRK